MANQKASSAAPIPATASIVGNAFVIRYYNILHQSLHLVHRFYTEESRLSRAEAWPSSSVEMAETVAGIHEKVMSLDYGGGRAEIKTVDSQQSLTGSVLVMVTGALHSAGGVKRNFAQTFLLVPQEKSYFVLNDMFRYLDGDAKPSQSVSPVTNATAEPHVTGNTVSVQEVSKPTVFQDINPSDPAETEADVLAEDSYYLTEYADRNGDSVEDAINEQQEMPVSKPNGIPASSKKEFEKASKKSYASILRVRKKGSRASVVVAEVSTSKIVEQSTSSAPQAAQDAPQSSTRASDHPTESTSSVSPARVRKNGSKGPVLVKEAAHSKTIVHSMSQGARPPPYPSTGTSSTRDHTSQAAPTTSQPSAGANSTLDRVEESTIVENEGDSRSVYVKNLPLNVTAAELEGELSKFGQLKPGGVNLRNQRAGVCFAFVEFEEASSAQSATEASPITIGGRQVYVKEKRPMPFRGGRGRFNPGRGYQNEGMRGWGYFNARWPGRGGQDSDKDFSRGDKDLSGGRGLGSIRGGYGGGNSYTSHISFPSFNSTHGYRRLDSQNGNGFRPVRRGAGNQMGRNGPVARNGVAVAAA